ncbi:hypothetical protein Tco_0324337 [Tanacetum coccineum]
MVSIFGTLGDADFAYVCHNVVLEIQETIPLTPKKPSKDPMWKGAVLTYIASCSYLLLSGCQRIKIKAGHDIEATAGAAPPI